jgi:carbon-monoxide dehydrogenase medium subunit
MLTPFRLEEPRSVQEASILLARYGESARIYAGGTELLLAMKESLVRPSALINLKNIPGLNHIKVENGVVRLGALATHRKLEESQILQDYFPALVEMEHHVANVRVREAGTLGGNLCFAEPHSDPAALLMALGARLVARKGESAREIAIENFITGAFETSLGPDEILSEILLPLPAARSAAAYLKLGYLERPTVGVALSMTLTDGAVSDARIGVGSAGPQPKRVEEAEAQLRGRGLKECAAAIDGAGKIAARAAEAISDLHGPADYKEHLIEVLLRRLFKSVSERLNQRRKGHA